MLGGLWEPRQAFFREVTWKKWSATALGTPRCSFLFLFFKNCGHLVLAPQLDLGWKPHIWNVFVFPLTGEYFGVCYLILLVRLPCCDQVPLPRRLGSHPPLGWRSLVPGPTGSLWALIMWLMMALKLIPHKVDLGGDLEQNWQEGNQPTAPSDANLSSFSPPCLQQTTKGRLGILCIPSWACMTVYSVCQL